VPNPRTLRWQATPGDTMQEIRSMTNRAGRVTVLLKAIRAGDGTAEQDPLPGVYQELRRLAQAYMRR
jgi:hypothetical protein